MNERINELAIQAGGIWRGGYVDNHAGDGIWTDRKFVVDVDTEQFAQLLIRECADKIERDYKYERGEDTKWITAFGIACDLKRHFGVEE
jgi:hypothetical protein